jgi:tRNA U38,U39,U40 pseudouridine synthase TruA
MTEEEFNIYIEECIKSEIETFYPEEFEARYGQKSRYYSYKMKIYTYYENINFTQQDELVELWKKSWTDNGFEPIVLSLEDAQKSVFYEEFIEQCNSLVFKVTGNKLSRYGLSCYLRWLAYSTQKTTDSFLVSDYDVINIRFSPVHMLESIKQISFMDRLCPCLAYGNSEQFLNFCKDIINITSTNLEQIKVDYLNNQDRCYHDQNFLVLNKERLGNYNICPARKYVMPYIHNDHIMKECGLIHFSHRSVATAKEGFKELSEIHSNELRVKLIKELLKKETINLF